LGRGIWSGEQGSIWGEEFAELDFHSLQLEDRFIRTMKTLMKQLDKSIGEDLGNQAEESVKANTRIKESCLRILWIYLFCLSYAWFFE
jgi:hypothetical protein